MKYRALITISGLIACAAGTAGAQATVAPATHELAPVTVIAPSHGAVYRIAHIDEQRQYVLGLMDENRRLGADLRRADAKVAQLEGRLLEAKADHDRRVAGIAAIDSAAAETRRMRLELEEKLRRLEPTTTQDNNSGTR
jgi:hypothetical protein